MLRESDLERQKLAEELEAMKIQVFFFLKKKLNYANLIGT